MRVGLSTVGKDLDRREWIKRREIDHSTFKKSKSMFFYLYHLFSLAASSSACTAMLSLRLIESTMCCGALLVVCFKLLWVFMYVLFACVCLVYLFVFVVCMCLFVCAVVKWWLWERQPQPRNLWMSRVRAMMVASHLQQHASTVMVSIFFSIKLNFNSGRKEICVFIGFVLLW